MFQYLLTLAEGRVEKSTYIYEGSYFSFIHTVRVSLYKNAITYIRSDDVMAVPFNIKNLKDVTWCCLLERTDFSRETAAAIFMVRVLP